MSSLVHISTSIIFNNMGTIYGTLSYLNVASRLKKIFALMHPEFKSNLMTHIFRNIGVSQTTESDVIFAFVRGT